MRPTELTVGPPHLKLVGAPAARRQDDSRAERGVTTESEARHAHQFTARRCHEAGTFSLDRPLQVGRKYKQLYFLSTTYLLSGPWGRPRKYSGVGRGRNRRPRSYSLHSLSPLRGLGVRAAAVYGLVHDSSPGLNDFPTRPLGFPPEIECTHTRPRARRAN